MKKLFTLLGLFAVIAVAVLASCQKESRVENTISDSSVNQVGNEISSRTVLPVGPFDFRSDNAYIGCYPSFGVCNVWFPYPYPGDPTSPLEFNQAMGNATVTEDGSFSLHIDGSTLSSDFLEQIANDPVFRISSDYVIPQELVVQLYSESGFPVPEEGIIFPKGDYPVEFDINIEGEPQEKAALRPWWKLVDVNIDVTYTKDRNGTVTVHVVISCC